MSQGKCEACKQSGIEKVYNHCLDFIPPKEKRYAVVEVGGRNCALLSHDNICTQGGNCETCTKGQTLQEMVEKGAKAVHADSFTDKWEKVSENDKGFSRDMSRLAILTLIPQENK